MLTPLMPSFKTRDEPRERETTRRMEELRDNVSEALLTLGKPEELIAVCQALKCEEPETGGFQSLARRALIRLAENTLDTIEEKEDHDVLSQCLKDTLSLIKSMQTKVVEQMAPPPQENSELEQLKEKYSQLQKEQTEALKLLQGEIDAAGERVKTMTTFESKSTSSDTSKKIPEVTLRREFRISGQIGEAGQKDKLSYTGLMNQIETGQRKGHSETEIIEAVIRAVSPGLALRDLLEIKNNLTLAILKTILRGHYKVDSSSDLLHRLMTLSQDPKESAQNFLFRAMELREKLCKRGEEDEGEKLSADLIQRRFVRSLETGLISDAVKFQLKPYLSDYHVSDEVLIERVNEAENLEQERQQKLRKTGVQRPPRINDVQIEGPSNLPLSGFSGDGEAQHVGTDMSEKGGAASKNKKCQARCPEQNTDSQKQIEDLRAEIMEMKKVVLQTVGASQQPQPAVYMNSPRRRPPGCRSCREAQRGESCTHCYNCGQEGHLSRGCRQKREQGNGRGLLGQDRQ